VRGRDERGGRCETRGAREARETSGRGRARDTKSVRSVDFILNIPVASRRRDTDIESAIHVPLLPQDRIDTILYPRWPDRQLTSVSRHTSSVTSRRARQEIQTNFKIHDLATTA
jgi:hypothetical protein